ncbi:NADPH-dependent oxidoreductase [Rarobacter faecitabidus]|uniref:Nitroreductase n=1 Tax=Rarobacter faecitabidus TaxID=13243 RepID=A0A542ZUT5_RARFA|nr:nitroreductase family protein [Rarobacter faecitabidus]TQL64107.1 nitroreductase [Rarobacter faecitabidus]
MPEPDYLPEVSASIKDRYLRAPFPDVVAGNDTIDTLLAHRSIRRFVDEPVTETQVATMIAAAQSASSSSNLQLWSVVEVRDANTKAEIAELAGTDGAHLAAAPVVLFWVADLARATQLYRDVAADPAGYPAVPGDLLAESSEAGARNLETTLVAFGDALIAAQNAAIAAEAMGLGICYLGSTRNDVPGLACLLGLPEHSFVAVGLTVGHPNPARPTRIKTRLPIAAVWHRERYDLEGQRAQVAEYEAAANEFYTGQGMAPSWIQRNFARLFSRGAIGARTAMRGWLRERGMGAD